MEWTPTVGHGLAKAFSSINVKNDFTEQANRAFTRKVFLLPELSLLLVHHSRLQLSALLILPKVSLRASQCRQN